jgi:hypothetical protein
MDPNASHGQSLDVRDLRGIYTSGTSRTQNIEESLLWKVHAADPLHFTFRFLLVFQVFHLSFVMSWETAARVNPG